MYKGKRNITALNIPTIVGKRCAIHLSSTRRILVADLLGESI
jgi:hypothetical protein